MRKGYIAYLVIGTVLCIAGTIGIYRIVDTANAKIAGIGAEPALAAAPAPAPASPTVTAEAAAAAEAARKASEAQAARIAGELAKLAIPGPGEALLPKHAPVSGFAPSKAPSGRVYGNGDFRRDQAAPRVIVDFAPESAAGLEWQDAVRSKRCAAFSFIPDPKTGKRINRLFCDPVVAKN